MSSRWQQIRVRDRHDTNDSPYNQIPTRRQDGARSSRRGTGGCEGRRQGGSVLRKPKTVTLILRFHSLSTPPLAPPCWGPMMILRHWLPSVPNMASWRQRCTDQYTDMYLSLKRLSQRLALSRWPMETKMAHCG